MENLPVHQRAEESIYLEDAAKKPITVKPVERSLQEVAIKISGSQHEAQIVIIRRIDDLDKSIRLQFKILAGLLALISAGVCLALWALLSKSL